MTKKEWNDDAFRQLLSQHSEQQMDAYETVSTADDFMKRVMQDLPEVETATAGPEHATSGWLRTYEWVITYIVPAVILLYTGYLFVSRSLLALFKTRTVEMLDKGIKDIETHREIMHNQSFWDMVLQHLSTVPWTHVCITMLVLSGLAVSYIYERYYSKDSCLYYNTQCHKISGHK